MKKTLIALLFLAPICAAAQTSATTWHYMEVVYTTGGFSSKQKVEVDTGEDTTGWFKKIKFATDAEGKAIKFKTAIDALNHFGGEGWELVTMYVTADGVLVGQHYIMKKAD